MWNRRNTHTRQPFPSRRRLPAFATALAGLMLALAASGCGGGDTAACHQCYLQVSQTDPPDYKIETGSGAPISTFAAAAPIQFVVYRNRSVAGGDIRDPVSGAEVSLYTMGTADALVEDNRQTMQAVDGLWGRANLAAAGWVLSPAPVNPTDLDTSIVDATPAADNNRGIWRAVTDDHGAVTVFPVGYLPGCPVLVSGDLDVKMGGTFGVGAVVSDWYSEWFFDWEVTCKAPA